MSMNPTTNGAEAARRAGQVSSGHTRAIRASKVIGTSVYASNGDKIGKVEDVMLDKSTNQIMFGVVSFGGFLGMGEKFHPVPWAKLNYNDERDGYVVPFSKDQLERAPAHSIDELVAADSAAVRDATYSYYKTDRDW